MIMLLVFFFIELIFTFMLTQIGSVPRLKKLSWRRLCSAVHEMAFKRPRDKTFGGAIQ